MIITYVLTYTYVCEILRFRSYNNLKISAHHDHARLELVELSIRRAGACVRCTLTPRQR